MGCRLAVNDNIFFGGTGDLRLVLESLDVAALQSSLDSAESLRCRSRLLIYNTDQAQLQLVIMQSLIM